VAGTRWAVEEGFEQAKGEVGLDHPGLAGLRAGLVEVAPTPSGPRPARTL
jgi:hypothetical protein